MTEAKNEETKPDVPLCACGKCVVRRSRKDFFNSFPYNKDIASTYKSDFDWKKNDPENPDEVYNRSKHTAFEGQYKEHLPTSLISEMKMDFKPFKVKVDEKKKEKKKPFVIKFFGRSSYDQSYPDWGSSPVYNGNETKMPEINVPLRGSSNYKENYPRYDQKFYQKREPLENSKGSLNFFGNFNPRSSYAEEYKPVDFSNVNYFPTEPLINTAQGENTVFKPAPYPKNNFSSEYGSNFVPYDDKSCKLTKYFISKGLRYLEI